MEAGNDRENLSVASVRFDLGLVGLLPALVSRFGVLCGFSFARVVGLAGSLLAPLEYVRALLSRRRLLVARLHFFPVAQVTLIYRDGTRLCGLSWDRAWGLIVSTVRFDFVDRTAEFLWKERSLLPREHRAVNNHAERKNL